MDVEASKTSTHEKKGHPRIKTSTHEKKGHRGIKTSTHEKKDIGASNIDA